MPTVYICHAVDTEGPLYESIEATFERIKQTFDITLRPTRENILNIRKKKLNLNGHEDAIAELVREDQIDTYKQSWDQLDKMHETVMSEKWRDKLLDSKKNPYVISWYCMDHVNYKSNPRRRSMGFHSVFEAYTSYLNNFKLNRDRIYWHFHPPSFSGDAHHLGRGTLINLIHDEILVRRVIDHMWFPVSNRPGGHTETYEINSWLERWIPFDLANQNMENDIGKKSLENNGILPGRFSDWRGAPTDWSIYHPDFHDFRKPGNMKRMISRCLNINARYSSINEDEIAKAFKQARLNGHVLMAVTNHDFRDFINETEGFYSKLKSVSENFIDVEYVFCNAVEGFRKVLGMNKIKSIPNAICQIEPNFLRVQLDSGIWNEEPFLAIKTKDGRYCHGTFIDNGNGEYTYPLDAATLRIEQLDTIGIAYHDKVGNTTVLRNELKNNVWETKHWNLEDWL